MTAIRLVDVTMRDGNQSLWGATGLHTAHMLQAAALTQACGFAAIDFTSSSHMAVAVRYFRNNPWERLRRMAAAMPTTPLQFITTGLRFIAWQQADPEFMRLVYRTLQTNGVGRFVLLDPMHEVPAVIEAARLVKQEGGAQVMAALTFTLSAIHTDGFYADFARALAQCPDIDLFYIKDPGGLLSVDRVRTLVPAVKAVIGAKPLEIHAHTTIGQGMLTSLEAARLGISAIHVGVGPGGDGSSCQRRTAWSPTWKRPGTRWTSTRRRWRGSPPIGSGSRWPKVCRQARRRISMPASCATRSPAG
jgi:oxaloacetate decarboxylase alpha subunit